MADRGIDLGAGRSEVYYLGRRETTAERVRRLQAQARIVAREHMELLEQRLLQAADVARQIAEGGEAYPAGVRELASRMSDDLPSRVSTLRALIDRAPSAKL